MLSDKQMYFLPFLKASTVFSELLCIFSIQFFQEECDLPRPGIEPVTFEVAVERAFSRATTAISVLYRFKRCVNFKSNQTLVMVKIAF